MTPSPPDGPAALPWLLVVNPTACSDRAAGRRADALAALAASGLEVQLMETEPDGGTVDAVAHRLRTAEWAGVIAMGGDGTFHEVANALLRSERVLPFGLIPAGTGNNQARSLGIPLDDLLAAARCIAGGRTAPLDGAWVRVWDDRGALAGEAWAFDSLSFGFSARALLFRFEDKAQVEQVPILRDLWRDELVYAGAAARALLGTYVDDHRFDAWVTTEQGSVHYQDLHDLILNNTRAYARAWVIDPTSRHDDGLFELLPIHGMDEWAEHAVVRLEGNALRDWLSIGPDPAIVRAARFDIELYDRSAEPPIPAQVDGEPWLPVRRAHVEVRQGVLSGLGARPAP